MSKVVVLKNERASLPDEYLGPATVVTARGRALTLEMPGGAVVEATLALAFSYEPTAGDVLLVIGRRGDFYGIGLLQGSGKTSLDFQGDVDLRAGGTLRISAGEGVEIESPRAELRTGKLEMVAGAVVQRFTSLYQRVSALFSMHAKDAHTVVEESHVTQAKSGVILTEEAMSINGKQINLG